MADVNITVGIVSKQANDALQKLGAQFGAVDTSVNKFGRSAQAGLDKAGKAAKGFGSDASKAFSIARGAFASFLGNIAATSVQAAFRFISNGITSVATGSIKAGANFEALNARLVTLIGSTKVAGELFQDLVEFSSRTPFQLEQITEAAARLKSFGSEVNQIVPRLQILGDVAAASGSDLGELTLIFGQIQAAGKLTGERLLQLQERAVPIGPALAQTLGVAESSIRDLVKAGKVSFADFEKAFNSLNQEGNFAFGGIARASLTFNGALSTLKDNINIFQATLGGFITNFEAVKGAIAGFSAVFQTFGKILKDNETSIKEFVNSVASKIPAALQFAGDAFAGFIEAVNFGRFILFQIDGLISFVTTGLLNFAKTAVEAGIAVGKFLNQDTSALEATRENLEFLIESENGFRKANDEATEAAVSNGDKLKRAVQSATTTTVEAYKTASNATVQAIKDQEAADDERSRKYQENANNDVAATVEKNDKIRQLEKDEAVAREEARLLQQEEDEINFTNGLETLQGRLDQERLIRYQAELNKAKDQQEIAEIVAKAKKDAAEEEVENEKRRLTRIVVLERLFGEKRAQNISDTQDYIAKSSADGSKELFAIQKASAITTATIDGYIAIQKALSAAPPPLNFVLAAVVGAFTAANIRSIASQQQPKFRDGGIVPGNSFSGDSVTAQVNSGEMILNRQQQSNLFNLVNSGQSTGASAQVFNLTSVVQLDGQEIARSVSRQVANGVALGDFE